MAAASHVLRVSVTDHPRIAARSARRTQLRPRLGHEAVQLDAHARRIELHASLGKVPDDPVDDVAVARLLQIGRYDVARIGLRGLAGEAEALRRPEPQKLVAPRLGLEGELLVLLELALVAFLAFVEGGHLSLDPMLARRAATPYMTWRDQPHEYCSACAR